MPSISWRTQSRFHPHDCEKCEYLFSIAELDLGGKADVYKSCERLKPGHGEFLIRLGPETHDYMTADLQTLVWGELRAIEAKGWVVHRVDKQKRIANIFKHITTDEKGIEILSKFYDGLDQAIAYLTWFRDERPECPNTCNVRGVVEALDILIAIYNTMEDPEHLEVLEDELDK